MKRKLAVALICFCSSIANAEFVSGNIPARGLEPAQNQDTPAVALKPVASNDHIMVIVNGSDKYTMFVKYALCNNFNYKCGPMLEIKIENKNNGSPWAVIETKPQQIAEVFAASAKDPQGNEIARAKYTLPGKDYSLCSHHILPGASVILNDYGTPLVMCSPSSSFPNG